MSCALCFGHMLTHNDPRPLPLKGPVCGDCNRRVVLPVRDLVWGAERAHRAALVRAIVGQQWVEMVCAARYDPFEIMATASSDDEAPPVPVRLLFGDNGHNRKLAALSCAVDVVRDILGEP